MSDSDSSEAEPIVNTGILGVFQIRNNIKSKEMYYLQIISLNFSLIENSLYILNVKNRINPETFQKLKQCLTCAICLNVFVEPVYIKDCSHRFCKTCIQKYIRSQEKKSCPQCRKKIGTKRQLRLDENIMFLMEAVFGDVNKYIKEEDQEMLQLLDKIEKITPQFQQQNFKRQKQNNNSNNFNNQPLPYQRRKKIQQNHIQQNQLPLQNTETELLQQTQQETILDMDNFNQIKQLVDSGTPITISIQLKLHPMCFWASQVDFNVIRTKCNYISSVTLLQIQEYLCKILPITDKKDQKFLNFFVKNNEQFLYQPLESSLQTLNDKYWHFYQDLELYDTDDLLKRYIDPDQTLPSGEQRLLYYELSKDIFG